MVKADLVVIRAEQGVRFSATTEDAADNLMDYISSEVCGDTLDHTCLER